ncbi:hypothetical protein UPYG_G00073210 [Umbra pygmaea]|uniref:receptor protein-tyrosine kinase n=1 Tax=Umbra pygmaea TaxID=75934 RepID=A0ABD0XRU8_UMBPY
MSLQGRSRVVIAALMLLCTRCDGNASQPQRNALQPLCNKPKETLVTLFEPDLNSSGPIRLNVPAGHLLNVTMQCLPGDPVCKWTRGDSPVRGGYCMIIPLTSQSDAGEYTFSCVRNGSSNSTWTLVLDIGPPLRRPSRPDLKLVEKGPGYLPEFQCSSDGYPKPTMKWYNDLDQMGSVSGLTVESGDLVTSKRTMKDHLENTVMCCADNTKGVACSHLYDYDLDRAFNEKDEAPEIIVKPGHSLLLRCRTKSNKPSWLPHTKDSVFIKDAAYRGHAMTYLYIKVLAANHSGNYTCSSTTKTKSTHIQVLEKSFISLSLLNKSYTISAKEKPEFCLQPQVSSHPPLQCCYWLAPNKTSIKCPEHTRSWKNRILSLCNADKGMYQLHLETEEQNLTIYTSLCVTDAPTFNLFMEENSTTCETITPLPFNLIWMFSNLSSQLQSPWSNLSSTILEHSDSDQFCHQKVRSSLSSEDLEGYVVKCCITNSAYSQPQCSDSVVIPVKIAPREIPIFQPPPFHFWKFGCTVLLLALSLVVMALLYFIRKKKPKYQSQLQMIQMIGPNDNDYIYINFKDFQYDQKWEFPRENLELGRELGSGAFGMVVQATAYGISKPGVSQQVAVKMLKEKHETVEKEALISELKMLTHIGQHENIVNLMGACTNSGPTYLIFQYCSKGDLLNYLKNNRELYHKSLSEAFTGDRFSSLYHNLPKASSSEHQKPANNSYIHMSPVPSLGQENSALLSLSYSCMGISDGQVIDEDLKDLQEDELDQKALTYNDLLNFSCQVAKGMDFLSSKQCIHRDLAARNVLVTQGGWVKIGDFGLARDIENDSNYVVKGNVRLPVKWMAPESIFQGIYTMQSDVWAYGILLWEIFSLGVTPYPGIKVDKSFYVMIERGYKMEQPYYASDSVYKMMGECWSLEPKDRPYFSKLVAFMDNELTCMEEMLYCNILDKSSNDSIYQNSTVKSDLSALAKEKEVLQIQLQNEYCKTHSTGEARTTTQADCIAMETNDDEVEKPLIPCL